MAGVSIKLPATIVLIKGRPKSRKGCFWSALRYFAASELGSVALKDLEENGPGIVAGEWWRVVQWVGGVLLLRGRLCNCCSVFSRAAIAVAVYDAAMA